MYLDKPLRAHTLFQAVTRTNRRWTNPNTDQEKLYGLVVDYVGLGTELAKAVAARDTGTGRERPSDTAELVDVLSEYVHECVARFDGIDRSASAFEQLMTAQERLADSEARRGFAEPFLRCEGLFEFLRPDTALRSIEVNYRWLARVYKSIAPTGVADKLLWHRLDAKTAELITEHLHGVTVDDTGLETIAVDAGVFEALRELELFPTPIDPKRPPTLAEVLDSIEARLRRKLDGPDVHPVWRSLADRLEVLRQARLADTTASVDFLKQILDLAREVVEAEKQRGRWDARHDERAAGTAQGSAHADLPGVRTRRATGDHRARRRADRRHRQAGAWFGLAEQLPWRPRSPAAAAPCPLTQRPSGNW